MLFNSISFFVFLSLFFACYWFIFHRNTKVQNALILIGSYIFYGWWDPKFLSLIFLSTLVDYIVGIHIHNAKPKKAKWLLLISICCNLSFLGFFKYYGFFAESLQTALSSIGYRANLPSLNIILPVGISFYTFQTMSYTIDIYKKKLKPTKDFIAFAAFVAFFPQLVAGPIERASNLLPQILKKRRFRYEQGVQGLRLILWGLYKKLLIADGIAPEVDAIFENYQAAGAGHLILGAVLFSIQIYCDFSGYSDIAIGTSKLLGFELISNFRFPFFSRNIGEFWRRWHISLSTWFRDYLYIPMGGSRYGKWKSLRNITVVFLISGFWHGANWTFILWGGVHVLAFIPSFLWGTNRKFSQKKAVGSGNGIPSLLELFQMMRTFTIVSLAFIIFRSESLGDALNYLQRLFYKLFELSLRTPTLSPSSLTLNKLNPFLIGDIITVGLLILLEWFMRKDERLTKFQLRYKLHYVVYLIISSHIFWRLSLTLFSNDPNDFIYFQF